MTDYDDFTDCPICPQLATDRDDALRELVNERHIAKLVYEQAQAWQEMAEDLWEELQTWHTERCPSRNLRHGRVHACTCHRSLAEKWDELTYAASYADDEEKSP